MTPSSDSNRGKLIDEWGQFKKWYKFQPLDAIRKYFGVKIGIYFAWLGFFTGNLFELNFSEKWGA